jgi:hypothetical protein
VARYNKLKSLAKEQNEQLRIELDLEELSGLGVKKNE